MLWKVGWKIMSDLFCIQLWRTRSAAANKGRFGSCRALARVQSSFASYWIAPAVQSLKCILKALKDSCPAPLPHLPGWKRMRAFLIVSLCCTLGSSPARSPFSWCSNIKGRTSPWDSQQVQRDTSQPNAGWIILQIWSTSCCWQRERVLPEACFALWQPFDIHPAQSIIWILCCSAPPGR